MTGIMHHCQILIMPLVLGLGLPQTATAGPQGQFWASDSLTKVLRDATPQSSARSAVNMSGGRGETVSGQAIFRPASDADVATVQITDLRHRESGAEIPSRDVHLQWVRYIDIDRNTAGLPADEWVAQRRTVSQTPSGKAPPWP